MNFWRWLFGPKIILRCSKCRSDDLVGVRVCDGYDNGSRYCLNCGTDHYHGKNLIREEVT